ncbi:HAMP domain-containing methyl-accepting chemotaxis protein [Dongia deserti]|uniref:HAMP domain-containing methyl-accepting chemotaxis protein n=1 Tax=Dongia deserti TaxID=2268030 RepID=UPI000E6563D0|nr:methyl-accepting chemotaxis protein [Dongia deserti]
MTIGKKIVGGYAVVLAMLAFVAAVAFYSLNQVKATYDEFFDVNVQSMIRADELQFSMRDRTAHYRGLLLYPDLARDFTEKLQIENNEVRALLERMRRAGLSPEGARLLDEISSLNDSYVQTERRALEMVNRGDRAGAAEISERESRPINEALADKTQAFRDREARVIAAGREDAAEQANAYVLVMSLASALALIIALLLGSYLSRDITRRLKESVGQLATSATEILATTSQVASGAAETATAVSQTTATVEEVKQTAQLSSQKARYVSDSAQKVAQVSQTGRKSVDDAIQAMHRIQEQMESIAESIVRLSEQSQAIGEIIASVNDLAEQSNLLAVNAAIEATRAGEAGKGFGVVAQEVKNLAEQSKHATAQVRTILGDIQKATSAAVLATEQGNKAVEAGVKQSMEAGETIRLLAESIAEAAQAATQIAASSQQQMVGMDQVALAMENIKQASVQNVSGTKQAETAAQDLQRLGQKLNALVEARR